MDAQLELDVDNGEDEELSLRDELDTAFAEGEAREESSAEESPVSAAPEAELDTGTPDLESVADPDTGRAEDDTPGDELAATDVDTEANAGEKAPVGFTPEAREEWKNVPKVVQDQIQQREAQVNKVMQTTAAARKTHQAISQIANGYASVMAAENTTNPIQAIQGLFETVAQLRMGSPTQRATRLAQLVTHYGIDIPLLDQALSGQVPQEENNQLNSMLEQKLAPMQEMLARYQQNEQNTAKAAQNTAKAELTTFANEAEFLQEVRYDMADLIDMASKRGQTMGYKEAYQKACAMNEPISKILSDRAAAKQLVNSQQTIQGKKAASSSMPARSARGTATKANASLRDEIAGIWDDAS